MADDGLLEAVRAECPVGVWSLGVKLARDGAVSMADPSATEPSFRVRERGRAVATTVILYPEDKEWDCDCDGRVMPCMHIAASAIARAQGLVARATTPEEGAHAGSAHSVKLLYDFTVRHGALSLSRSLKSGEDVPVPLTLSLKDRVARSIASPPFQPTHDDMAVDRGLYHKVGGDVPQATLRSILAALSHSEHVTLDGEAVRTSDDWLTPEARVTDGPDGGVVVTIQVPEGVQVVAMGAGLSGGVLRPLAEAERFGLKFERLPLVSRFPRERLATVAGELVPELEKTMLVTVATRRLPGLVKRMRPRLEFELSHDHGALFVLPLIVYGDPPVARVDGDKLTFLRDTAPVREPELEKRLAEELRDALSLMPGRRVRFDGRDAVSFANRLEAFRGRGGVATKGEAAHARELAARVRAAEGGIAITFELPAEGDRPAQTVPLSAVAEAYRDGLSIVGLEGGGFASLPAAFLREHGAAILALAGEHEATGRAGHLAVREARELCDAVGVDLPASLARAARLLEEHAGLAAPKLAEGFRGELRPYQQHGASWLTFLREAELGGILADDMGLGKTVQILSVLRGRSLIVCPKSVVHNWRSELARFRPDLSVYVYEGASRSLETAADVVLTSYGLLRQDQERLADVEWDACVLDEAQAIKNPESQTARAAHAMRAKTRLCVSGTPIENRLDELWSLMRFAAPGLLGTRRDFSERVAQAIDRGDAEQASALRRRIKPFLLRRRKQEVLLDLPPRSEAVLYCELSEQERAAYDAVRAATQREVLAQLGEGKTPLLALEALLRLRQASCHRGLLPGQESETSSKVERLTDALAELAADGHRALVFSQWTSLLDRIEPALAAQEIKHCRLDGQTRDRQGVVEEFQSPDGPPVMLVSLKAGGTGLNLTAADHVFIVDPWWNPAVEEQAMDRAHRIGQDKPVMVFRLVSKDTVEEKILALQEKKRLLAGSILDGGSGAGAGLTREELLELLS